MTPFDQNLERLLKEAYQPETPDPAFVADLAARLQATARERAAVETGERRTLRLRRVMGTILAIAAAVAGILLVRHIQPVRESVSPLIPVGVEVAKSAPAQPAHLTPQPKAESIPSQVLAVGKQLQTDTRARRVALPDGSVLFVNRDSAVRLDGERRLVLEKGEIYVEVAQKDGERFIVQTPDRTVTALGTRFNVRADEHSTSVVVTQGKVQVSGLSSLLYAGQQLMPNADRAAPAPRASAVIDWTRDLMADGGLVPGSKYCGGALLAFDSAGQEAKISLRNFHLDVHIEDGFARTTIDQTYFNHETSQLEGTFYFPLPADSSISRLAMYVNGNLMEGGMAEREQARNTFEQIRYARRDPALLEWLDGSTFKMRVFPLEGRHEKRIVLSYTQRMPVLHGKASYRFPMGHNLQVVGEWSANVKVAGGSAQSWASPSHALQAATRDGALLLTNQAKQVKLDHDLQLELTDSNPAPTRFAQAELDGQRFLMLRHRPEISSQLTTDHKPLATHYVFLFETSADRDPLLARTQIEILRTLLENLEHTDTFQVLTAATRTKRVNDTPMAAVQENINSTIESLDKSHLIGAFDLENAIAAVDPLLRDHKGSWLVHIGSGIAALGERRADVLAGRIPEGSYYAGIGVGKRWSRPFMKTAAERTGGHYAQINPDESVQWRAFDFLASLKLPRWQNLTATDDSGREWLLTESSLCAGEELCAAARLAMEDTLPKQVTIRGQMDGKRFEQVLGVENVAEKAGYIPRTWGRLEIDRLMAANSDANKQKIIDLSKSLYVMSPYTSLLVLENEQMYQQFKIDRGRKDHWAMYPCPEKITDQAEPMPSNASPIAVKNEPKRERTVRDVLQSIMVRNVAPLGQAHSDEYKPITAWDMMTRQPKPILNAFAIEPGKVNINQLDNLGVGGLDNWREVLIMPLPIYSSWPEQGGFYRALGALHYRQDRDFSNQVIARRGLVDVDGSVPPDVGGRYIIPAPGATPVWVPERSMMASPYYLEHRPQYFRPDPDFPLEKELAQENGRLMPSKIPYLNWLYQNPPNGIGGNGVFSRNNGGGFGGQGGQGGFGFGGQGGGFGGGQGGFGQGGFGGQGGFNAANGFGGFNGSNYLNGTNFIPGANGFGMGGQHGFGGGQLGINGSWNLQQTGVGGGFNFNGWYTQFNGFQGNFGQGYLYGQFGFNGFSPNGANYWNGTPLTDRMRLLETKRTQFGPPADGAGVAPYKAMAVSMNPQMMVGGEIVPGRRVDVLRVERLPSGKSFSTAILKNVPVIGVDVNVSRQEPVPAMRNGQIPNEGDNTSGPSGPRQTVTMAVKQRDGLMLHEEAKRGELLMVLRDTPAMKLDPRKFFGDQLQESDLLKNGVVLYQQPSVTGINAQLLFRDLVAFAPGMETSQADILATIEAEAALEPVKLGRIDDMARKLIDAARAGGWRKNVIKLDDTTLNIAYDGAGRFAYDRVLPTGLREIVVCDGATLLHLYPEIGLGAKRPMSLYHRAEFAGLAPTALPPVEDLARGADVLSIDERTVAIVPHGDTKNKLELRLVFADGRVTERQVYDPATKKELQTDKIEQAKPAAAPNLKPDVSKLVVLPLPYRTVEAATSVAARRAFLWPTHFPDDRAMLLAAHFAAGTPDATLLNFISNSFETQEMRPGMVSLLRASGDSRSPTDLSRLPHSDADMVLVRYLSEAEQSSQNLQYLPARDGLLREMAQLHVIWHGWINGFNRQTPEQMDATWKRTREFIERNRHNTLGWLAMIVSAPYRNYNQLAWQSQAEAWQLFDSHPLFGYTARYERMRCLLNGGMPNTARMVFEDLYRETLAVGVIPPLDAAVKGLPANEMGVTWGGMLAKTAGDLAKKKHGFEALAIAQQCQQLGEPPLARDVLAAIEPEIKDAGPSLRLAAALFLTRCGDRSRADEYLSPILKEGYFADQPMVWRLAADLAGQRRNTSRLAVYLEKALDLEWEYMPEVVDVQSLRADYETLLNAYKQVMTAHQETDTKPPADLAAKIIKAADRWRALDPDPTLACQNAARLLRELGETELAWEYLTSPISLNPNEAARFQKLAEELKGNNEPVLAERAYAAAFAAEPTNAQYLMDRATLLKQIGRQAEARAVLRKLADGSWQPRFDAVKNQASAMLRD